MKRFFAILFAILLVWAQFAPTPAAACKVAIKCCKAPCAMPCCAAKNPEPRETPSALTQKIAAQNQISFLTTAMVIWVALENPANSASSFDPSPGTAANVPLYERNCTLLI